MNAGGANFNPAVLESGITIKDTRGDVLHAHGGGIIKVGDYFYWYGENRYDDQSFKSVRLYRSRTLQNWEFVKDILTDRSDADLNSAKIERPKIIYNRRTQQFVMWMHKEGSDNYGQARAAVAVADKIDGNYTYRGSFRPLDFMSRDCTAFVDDDGSAYFLSAANENADLHLYKLTDDYTAISSLVQKIWVGQKREAPALIKRNGVYFILSSTTSGWDPNQARFGTASSLSGTWSTPQNIGNSTTFDSQPTYILPIEGTQTRSYLYLGDRWMDPNYQDSKYVWLPLSFPTNTTMAFSWNTRVAVDATTGVMVGSGMEEVNLKSVNSGKCIDVASGSMEDRANIMQYTCSSDHNQKWRLREIVAGEFQIKALHSSRCMDVASGSTEDGANILQYACSNADNQRWRKQFATDGSFSLVSKHSNKCADVADWSTENSGNIRLWTCSGRENQRWIEVK
jgi:hypothetical protein